MTTNLQYVIPAGTASRPFALTALHPHTSPQRQAGLYATSLSQHRAVHTRQRTEQTARELTAALVSVAHLTYRVLRADAILVASAENRGSAAARASARAPFRSRQHKAISPQPPPSIVTPQQQSGAALAPLRRPCIPRCLSQGSARCLHLSFGRQRGCSCQARGSNGG